MAKNSSAFGVVDEQTGTAAAHRPYEDIIYLGDGGGRAPRGADAVPGGVMLAGAGCKGTAPTVGEHLVLLPGRVFSTGSSKRR